MIEKIRGIVKKLDDGNRQKLIKYVQNISNLTILLKKKNFGLTELYIGTIKINEI